MVATFRVDVVEEDLAPTEPVAGARDRDDPAARGCFEVGKEQARESEVAEVIHTELGFKAVGGEGLGVPHDAGVVHEHVELGFPTNGFGGPTHAGQVGQIQVDEFNVGFRVCADYSGYGFVAPVGIATPEKNPRSLVGKYLRRLEADTGVRSGYEDPLPALIGHIICGELGDHVVNPDFDRFWLLDYFAGKQGISTSEEEALEPKNVAVVLLDSLNRHMLGCYGGEEFATPNLDRFASQHATRFTRHYTGSLPCMPARHDILCGALDFLWKPWGSIEAWEKPITAVLHSAGVTSTLVTDHPHLFEAGGENYHTDFDGWDYVRGHEGDLWRTHKDPTWVGTPAMPARSGGWFFKKLLGFDMERGYDRSRTFFRTEEDYPGPRTMNAAARFLTEATPHHDRWFLFVDEFDPHEPFDTPAPWAGRYEDQPWDDEFVFWPPYIDGGISDGHITEAEGRHIRANYGSKLSMIDHWFGKVLEAFDERNLWDDTVLIVCTDHGHFLGDEREGRDIWGKPGVPQFEPLGHTPLLIHWPGNPGGDTIDALTTNVDLFATLADVFGVEVEHRTHGISMVPLLTGEADSIRDWVLGGYYGGWVQLTDGQHKLARGAVDDNFPASMWSNRWSTMPVHVPGLEMLPRPDERAWLDFMPGSTVPVIRQPFQPGDMLPMFMNDKCVDRHFLFDLDVDPDEQENRATEKVAGDLLDHLRSELQSVGAPDEQLERLGLT